jgi:hypothetical protein
MVPEPIRAKTPYNSEPIRDQTPQTIEPIRVKTPKNSDPIKFQTPQNTEPKRAWMPQNSSEPHLDQDNTGERRRDEIVYNCSTWYSYLDWWLLYWSEFTVI